MSTTSSTSTNEIGRRAPSRSIRSPFFTILKNGRFSRSPGPMIRDGRIDVTSSRLEYEKAIRSASALLSPYHSVGRNGSDSCNG